MLYALFLHFVAFTFTRSKLTLHIGIFAIAFAPSIADGGNKWLPWCPSSRLSFTFSRWHSHLTIANARSLFVCLFPIQIGATSWLVAKRAIPAEGCLGHVLRGLTCDYLPCGRMCEVFLGQRTGETHIYSTSCGLPSQEGMPWNTPRRTAEESPQDGLLGDQRATLYLSCGREDSPRYFKLAA